MTIISCMVQLKIMSICWNGKGEQFQKKILRGRTQMDSMISSIAWL
jgi:hypothetical protein